LIGCGYKAALERKSGLKNKEGWNMFKTVLLGGIALALAAGSVSAKELKSVGITVGSLGNPYFVALAKGAETEAKAINPGVKVTTASADYDLNKQFTQIDNFISSGVDLILVNAADPRAIAPAIKRAQAAGVVVIAVDVAAAGADATVQTNNVQAGAIACQYMVDKMGGKGDVIIENGPQVSAVIDRVKGCKDVLAKHPDVKVLSSDQDGKGSREGGMAAMQGYLTRFPSVNGVFAINDPQAIGSDLAAKQLNRTGITIVSVDGAPDIVGALKGGTQVQASSSQDPMEMGKLGVKVGYDIMNGKKPETQIMLMESKLVTRDNVGQYPGWSH
jgi:ribose transport system substrate-binding protein